MSLRWLPDALADFAAIVDYIAKDDPVAAIAQGDEIEQQIANLGQHPLLGKAGRVKGTRELVIARTPFIAVYRLRRKAVEILRILHGAQQWPSP